MAVQPFLNVKEEIIQEEIMTSNNGNTAIHSGTHGTKK